MKHYGVFVSIVLCLSLTGFLSVWFSRSWRKLTGKRPQLKSPYVLCWNCQRRLSKWSRYLRVDGYCSGHCRKLDTQKFTMLAQQRLEDDFRRSLDAITRKAHSR